MIGTCLGKDKSGYDVLVNFITASGSQSLSYVRRYVVDMDIKTEQQLIDDIGEALGLTKQNVVDAFFYSGETTTWDYTASTLPGSVVLPTEPPTEAPTEEPTQAPIDWYTDPPTEAPTQYPTQRPTQSPTEESIPIIPHTPAGPNQIKVVTDKTTAHPGDIINGQIFIGPDYRGRGVGSIQMRLSLPYDLDFVAGSGALAPGVKKAMGFDALDWGESSRILCGYATAADYSSSSETLLMTFRCRVSDSAYGTCTIGIDNIEIGSCETFEVYDDYYAGAAHVTISYQEPTTVQEPTTPPYQGDGLIYFDASSAGWNGAKILFYIYHLEAGQELAAWGSKKLAGTAIGDGMYSFDPYTIGFRKGRQYMIIFNNKDTTAETYQLLLNSSCLGDTAYCTGNRIENPVDSNKTSLEAVWSNSTLGPRLAITSIGNVVGTTCPANTTKYDMFLNFLTSDGKDGLANAMNFSYGRTQDEIIDGVASGLGLTEAEKNRAKAEAGLGGGVTSSPDQATTSPTSGSSYTEPTEDSYGYQVGSYYLTGKINGVNSGTSNVDKNLKFTRDNYNQMILQNVRLRKGDVVRVAKYNGMNTFTVYPDGTGRDVVINETGEYIFYFKPYELGNANYWYLTPGYLGDSVGRILGDVDGDEVVSIIDTTFIQRYLVGMTLSIDFTEKAADANEDGDVTVLDITLIQKWLIGIKSNDNIGKSVA